jgi:cell division protein FtsL
VTLQDIFYISAIIVIWLFLILSVFVAYQIYTTVNQIKRLTDNAQKIAMNFSIAKDYSVLSVLTFAKRIISRFM